MSSHRPNGSDATRKFPRQRSIVMASGKDSQGPDGCPGGREGVDAGFSGGDCVASGPVGGLALQEGPSCRVDYSHLDIRGRKTAAKGCLLGAIARTDPSPLSAVSLQTQYGRDVPVVSSVPLFIAIFGSTDGVRDPWEDVAMGAALAGVTLVCGGSACVDPLLKLGSGKKILAAPGLDRRIHAYRRCHRGLGELLMQMDIEDARLGMAEYLMDNHGLESLELKWGQGAASEDGDIKVHSLEWALELQRRGCLVIPDPSNPAIQAAYRNGAIKQFEHHRRLGFFDQELLLAECDRLRLLGFKRISLNIGDCGSRELDLALKWGSKAKIDRLALGGWRGGTGISSWGMMEEGGGPNLLLHANAVQSADRLAAEGQGVPELAFAGGFSGEDQWFKALALGSPYVKAIAIDGASMAAGEIVASVARWRENSGRLPSASRLGQTPPEICAYCDELASMLGKDETAKLPVGAIAVYAWVRKLSDGLREWMGKAGCLNPASIRRDDLVSLTRQCADLTGIPCPADACRQEAAAIFDA